MKIFTILVALTLMFEANAQTRADSGKNATTIALEKEMEYRKAPFADSLAKLQALLHILTASTPYYDAVNDFNFALGYMHNIVKQYFIAYNDLSDTVKKLIPLYTKVKSTDTTPAGTILIRSNIEAKAVFSIIDFEKINTFVLNLYNDMGNITLAGGDLEKNLTALLVAATTELNDKLWSSVTAATKSLKDAKATFTATLQVTSVTFSAALDAALISVSNKKAMDIINSFGKTKTDMELILKDSMIAYLLRSLAMRLGNSVGNVAFDNIVKALLDSNNLSWSSSSLSSLQNIIDMLGV